MAKVESKAYGLMDLHCAICNKTYQLQKQGSTWQLIVDGATVVSGFASIAAFFDITYDMLKDNISDII